MHIHVPTHTYAHIHSNICNHIHAHTYACIHTHKYTYMYAYFMVGHLNLPYSGITLQAIFGLIKIRVVMFLQIFFSWFRLMFKEFLSGPVARKLQ